MHRPPDQRTWSTAGFRAESQFAVWEQIVAEAFVPVRLTRPDSPGAGFVGDAGSRRLGDLWLTGVKAQRHSVQRTRTHIARRRSDAYFLAVAVRGASRLHQDDRVAHTGAGDAVLIDGDAPFRIDFAEPFARLCLTIPRTLLEPQVSDPRACTGVVVRGDGGAGALVTAFVRSIAEHADTVGPRQAAALTTHVVGLVALAASEACGPPTRRRAALLQQAVEEASRRLEDPDLGAESLARCLCISPSYLAKLFADQGTSFGRWLLARRLDRAWALLDPERGGERTITEVAAACGFRDSAHFSRAFRARFGTTPTQRRRMSA